MATVPPLMLRRVARQVIASAAEGGGTPGAWTAMVGGMLFLAWRSMFRSAILVELGIREIVCESHEDGRRYAQGVRQFADIEERNVALPALDTTQIASGQAALQSKLLLGPSHRPPDLGQMLTK